MLLLMLSLILKANVWSLIYLIFIFKYVRTKNKVNLLVRICSYLSISLALQYIVYLLNMTWRSSPRPFPEAFSTYPATASAKVDKDHIFLDSSNGLAPKLILPLFFHFRIFRD
jgi:hypothetical protein